MSSMQHKANFTTEHTSIGVVKQKIMMMDCFDLPSKHSTSEERILPIPQSLDATRQTPV